MAYLILFIQKIQVLWYCYPETVVIGETANSENHKNASETVQRSSPLFFSFSSNLAAATSRLIRNFAASVRSRCRRFTFLAQGAAHGKSKRVVRGRLCDGIQRFRQRKVAGDTAILV